MADEESKEEMEKSAPATPAVEQTEGEASTPAQEEQPSEQTEQPDQAEQPEQTEQQAETDKSPTPAENEEQTAATEEAAPRDTEQTGEATPAGEAAEESGDAAPEGQAGTPPAGTPQDGGDEEPPKTADGEPGSPPKTADGEQAPAEGDSPAADGEQAAVAEGEQTTEGEQAPAEGEHTTAEGDQAAPDGEAADAAPKGDGEGAGDEQAAEGSEAPAEGETPAEGEEGASAADGEPGDAVSEGVRETIPEGEEGDEEAAQEDGQTAEDGPKESDNFAEGERTESPVAVGEKLSREGTPTEQTAEDEERMESPPVPATPDRGSEADDDEEQEDDEEEYDEEEYDDEEEEPAYNRDELIERYHQSLAERQQFQEQNYQLQHKLAEYFRKKKSDEARQDMDKNVTDQEQRYLKYMANLDELRRQDGEERDYYKMQIEELKERCEEKRDRVEDERLKFMEFKKQVGLGAVNSRSGKPIPQRDIDQYLATEARKEGEVVAVRLENIKLKNKLKKKEMQLKSKEELAEGLHLIDFEQLKIENQTYNEKIEERNEELLKLRKKITSTVQVLTHLKEKLQFVQAENHVQKAKLRDVEEHAAKKRDILSRTKQARDALRIDNQKLRQNCGLLGNEPLLRDFEERKDEGDDLKGKLDELKMLHAELTLNLNGVRRKIEQARAGRA